LIPDTIFTVFVVLELTEGRISAAGLELCKRISNSYKSHNAILTGIVIGGTEISNAESFCNCGIRDIIHIKTQQQGFAIKGLRNALRVFVNKPGIVHTYFLHTSHSMDVAPILAATVQQHILTDCTNVEDITRIARHIMGGKYSETTDISNASCIITIRQSHEQLLDMPVEYTMHEQSIENMEESMCYSLASSNSAQKDIVEAEIIIAGGRGMQSQENFAILFALAEKLQGSVGASRAVVDAGWISHEHQVGQTGKTVSPNLYIACGISGSVQHLAGMSSSKCIVAINTDRNAPIFSVADYGISGDTLEILPKFIDELKSFI